jgi:NAD(P)-dependent dehydrogenase (short-subunit alcohol dehydrogenase family)
MATELALLLVNAIHPGNVSDSPRWRGVDVSVVVERTPIGRTVTMAEVSDAVDFLLRDGGVNAQELYMEGGWLVR